MKRIPLPKADHAFLAVDLAGTFVFALQGAMTAIDARLDLFGMMVLAFATASAGGIIRDLLVGAVPPNSVRDWRYGMVAFLAAATAFCLFTIVRQIPSSLMMTLDAAGLALFAVSGAAKAHDHGINPFMSSLMGAISGAGGGTIRDILLAQVPAVLRADIYAVAALAGAAVLIAGLRAGAPRAAMMFAGGAVCFLLRVISVLLHWNLPRVMP